MSVPRPKLDAEQFAARIPSQMLVRLLDLVEEFGVAPKRLCAGLSCSVEGLRRGEPSSNCQVWRMIRRALRLTGRADLGLELGIRENFTHFGLPGLAMSVARTLKEAVEIAVLYQNQTGGVSKVTFECGDDSAALVVDSNLHDKSVLPFVMEEFFASALAMARQLVGDHFQLQTLELAYPEVAHAERYRQVFGCPVRFSCSRNRVRIDLRWLDAPIPTHSAARAAQLHALLEQQAQAGAPPPRSTAAVEQLLLRPGNIRLSIDQVADLLQLSVRTLRRRLMEDGTSFRALSERVRLQTALRLLQEGMTVAAAAGRLGFSDVRAFRRAFKRRLGEVPSKMRQIIEHRASLTSSSPDRPDPQES